MIALVALIAVLVLWALLSGGGDDEPAGHDDGAGGPAESITPGPTPSESLIDERPGGREESDSSGGGDEESDGTGDDETGDGGEQDGGEQAGDGAGAEEDEAAADGAGSGDGGGLDPAGVPLCETSDLELSLVPAVNAYPPGEEPELLLTVENTSGSACRVDFGHGELTVTVADTADERVWTSDHCPEGPASEPAVVPVGGSVTHPVTWDRRHSTDDCDTRGDEAAFGTYVAEAELSGLPAGPTSFRLDED